MTITLLSYAPVFVSYMVTNAFIVSGVLRHWNDIPQMAPTEQIKTNETNC